MKKIIAIVLAVVLVLVYFAVDKGLFSVSLLTQDVEVTCTCPGCEAAAKKAESGENVGAYKKLTTSSKSGVDCSKLSESSTPAEMLAVYKDVANATRAAKSQTIHVVDEGAKIAIKSVSLDKTGEPLGGTMMGIVDSLIKQFSPEPVEYNYKFVDGKDTNGNKDDDTGEAKDIRFSIPLRDKDTMCELTDADIAEAKFEKLNDGYIKITFTITDSKFTFKDPKETPETSQGRGMSVMHSKDLIKDFGGAAKISQADLEYKGCKLIAVIDPASGYLVQLYSALNTYGNIVGEISTAGIGGIHGELDKTTYYVTYNWTEIAA